MDLKIRKTNSDYNGNTNSTHFVCGPTTQIGSMQLHCSGF